MKQGMSCMMRALSKAHSCPQRGPHWHHSVNQWVWSFRTHGRGVRHRCGVERGHHAESPSVVPSSSAPGPSQAGADASH
eukprot:scaffold133193_cov24-Phaeocystis_antarctica.AAC.1